MQERKIDFWTIVLYVLIILSVVYLIYRYYYRLKRDAVDDLILKQRGQ